MYAKHVRETILPLSVSNSLPAAFGEWHYTGYKIDHEDADYTCQMCGQEGLRYHFEIRNDSTDAELMVGSHCILSFDVEVRHQGRVLTREEAKRHLDELIAQMQFSTALKALNNLYGVNPHDVTKTAIRYFRTNKALSPKLASAVFWQFQSNDIRYNPTHFAIQLRRSQHKVDYDQLTPAGRARVLAALTSAQKKALVKRGALVPSSPQKS
jgi:hypothetical protein